MPDLSAASHDFLAFLATVLKDSERGVPLRPAAIHVSWLLHVRYCWDRGLGCLINAPMSHGKSTVLAIGLPAFLIGVNPNERIKVVSATAPLAKDRVGNIRQYISHDKDYRAAFPHVREARSDTWARHKLYVQRTGQSPDATIEGYGVTSTGVGGRASVILFDDPVDIKNAATAETRKSVSNAFRLTWLTRLEPTGRWLMISTPYHEEDLNAELRANPEVCTLVEAVSEDAAGIDFAVHNAPDDRHPLRAWAGV